MSDQIIVAYMYDVLCILITYLTIISVQRFFNSLFSFACCSHVIFGLGFLFSIVIFYIYGHLYLYSLRRQRSSISMQR